MRTCGSEFARQRQEHVFAWRFLPRRLHTVLCLTIALSLLGQNSAASEQAGWHFEDVFTVGHDSGSVTFASVAGLAFGAPGQLLVLDSQAAEVSVFDVESGRSLKKIGGKGQGPGEFVRPTHIAAMRNGGFYVYDMRSGNSIFQFTSDGTFLASTRIPRRASTGLITGMSVTDSGLILMRTPPPVQLPGRSGVRHPQLVLRRSDNGSEQEIWNWTELASEPMTPQGARGSGIKLFVEPTPIWSHLTNDRLAIGASDRYEVAIVDLQGRVTATLTRDIEPRPITAEEKEKFRAQFPVDMRDHIEVGDFVPQISRVFPGPDDTVLVLRGVGGVDGTGGMVSDVFTSNGQFITELDLPTGFRTIAGRDGFLAGVEQTDDLESAVRVLRIRR